MLISPAYAQDVAGMSSAVVQFLPLLLIFGVFYFLLIRPQQARAKEIERGEAGRRQRHEVMPRRLDPAPATPRVKPGDAGEASGYRIT